MKTKTTAALTFLLFLGISAYVFGRIDGTIAKADVMGWDASQNLTIAYNMYHHGAYSLAGHNGQDASTMTPTSLREPGLPIAMYLMFFLDEELRKAPYESLERGFQWRNDPDRESTATVYYRGLVKQQAVILLATIALSFFAVLLLTGSYPVAWLVGLLVATSPGFGDYNLRILSEGLASALLLALSIMLFLSERKHNLGIFLLSGLLFGLLALTKSAFVYIFVGAVMVMLFRVFLARKNKKVLKRHLTFICCMLLGFSVLVGPWVIRNHIYAQGETGADRGTGVLFTRLAFNSMTTDEYFLGFLAWFPGMTAYDGILQNDRFYAHAEMEPRTSPYDRLSPNRFTERVRNDERYSNKTNDEITSILVREAASNPAKHFLTSSLLFFRTLTMERIRPQFLEQAIDSWKLRGAIALAENAVLMGALFLLLFRGRSNPGFFMFSVISIGCLGFHVLLTHNIIRYTIPILPIMYVSLGFYLSLLVSRVAPRIAERG